MAPVQQQLCLLFLAFLALGAAGVRVKEQTAIDLVHELNGPTTGIASPTPSSLSPSPSAGTGVGTGTSASTSTGSGSNAQTNWANLANLMMNGGLAMGTGLLNGYAQGGVQAPNQQPQTWGNAMANGAMSAGQNVFQGMAGQPGMPAPCNTTGNPYSQIFGGLLRGFGQFGSNVLQQMQNGANSAVPMWQRFKNASANSWNQQTNQMRNWWNQANVPQQAGMYAGQFANQMSGAVGQQLANSMDLNTLAAKLGIQPNALAGLMQNPSAQGAMQLAQNQVGQVGQMANAQLPALAQQTGMSQDQLTSLLSNEHLQAVLDQMPAGDMKNTLQALAASVGTGAGASGGGGTSSPVSPGSVGVVGGAADPMLAALAAAQGQQR